MRKSTIDNNSQLDYGEGAHPFEQNGMHTRSVQQQPLGPINVIPKIQGNASIKKSTHNQSVESTQDYFDKKSNARKKRTFNILKQFDPQLASEIIYKESLQSHRIHRSNNEEQSRRHLSAIVIQKYFRRHLAKKEYEKLMMDKLLKEEERYRRQEEVRLEQWLIECETARLEKEIEDRNLFLKYQIKKRDDAAINIQRAVRRYFRKKNKGISMTFMLDQKDLESAGELDTQGDRLMKILESSRLEAGMEESYPQRSARSARSVGASAFRSSRDLMQNRMRQLQIETSGQGLVLQASTTPIGMNGSLIIASHQHQPLSQSMNQSRTPNNVRSIVRQQEILNASNAYEDRVYSDEESKKNRLQQKSGLPFNFSDAIRYTSGIESMTSPFHSIQKQYNLLGATNENQNITNSELHIANQLDNSLNSLFDSLKQPIIRENRFDLTQKISETIGWIDKAKQQSKQQNKSLYNQFLREQTVHDQMLIQDDTQQNLPQFSSKEDSQNSLLQLIPPLSCHDQTFNSSGGSSEPLGDNLKLQEADFPMTQLIKERTINYFVLSEEGGSSSDDNEKMRQQDKYSQELCERYKYFRELVQQFNSKEEKLRQLNQKRDEMHRSIKFYQGLFQNFNNLLEKVGGQQSFRGLVKKKKQVVVQRTDQMADQQKQVKQRRVKSPTKQK